MFNIGGGEMMMLGLLALLVFGPQDLPGIVKKVMRTVRALRTAASDFQTEVHSALEFENQKADQEQRQRKIPEAAKPAQLDTDTAPEPTTEEAEPETLAEESQTEEIATSEAEAELEPDSDSEQNVQAEAVESPETDVEVQEGDTLSENSEPGEDVPEEEDDDGPGLPMAPPKKRAESP